MLAAKVSQLHKDAVVAERIASFWGKQIAFYGEAKAEEFYKSLGLNHLETKATFDWEGMTLSREPTDIEKLCIKSIAAAQDTSKESITTNLMALREVLIDRGMTAIKKLEPADYHTLVLEVPQSLWNDLRVLLDKVFMQGKKLVARELNKQKEAKQTAQTNDDEFFLDDLTDLTDSRVVNDVQARIIAAVARFTLLGLTGSELSKAVRDEVETGSVSYIDRAATGLANKVLNFGRSREAEDRSDEWDRVEYSAILDQNVCSPCAAEDGKTAKDEADLQPTPNPECEGGDWCRCFWVYLNQ